MPNSGDVVEIELGLAHLVGIEIPVGRSELEAALLRIDHLLDLAGFAARACGGGRNHVGHQLDRILRLLGHLVGQAVGGKVGVAEQLGALGAQLRKTRDERARVVGVAMAGTGFRSGKHLQAQVTVGQ